MVYFLKLQRQGREKMKEEETVALMLQDEEQKWNDVRASGHKAP
jgi:hypothetical protein